MTQNACPHLEFGKDISASKAPLHPPTANPKRILVIGGGVTGLVPAWLLLDKGYHVTIISKEWASYTKSQRLTSQIAGALWEFPPGGCGPQPVQGSVRHCQDWAMESYGVYCAIAADPQLAANMGLRMRSLGMLFPYSIETDDTKLEKMEAIRNSAIRGFKRSPSVLERRTISPDFGIVDAYEHDAPVIDSDQGMQFLMQLVHNKGAKLVTGEIKGQLWDHETDLLATFSADGIVNATGLGAHFLAADDAVYPVRGGVLRVVNDGKDFPQVTTAAIVSTETDETGNYRDVIFMVPRNDNILILGSIVQPHQWVTNLTLDSPEVKDLRARFERFMPALRNARLDPEYPFAQGLRPFRLGTPRVERETKTRAGAPSRIVHSYGQGGAGWSMAFGCAAECVALVEEMLTEEPAPLKSKL
ncbi:hypothetical protein GJ744_005201 [Endocarpon pusillum]|uniref:FAD dependent oxidoreductase domain-containing protein n=1 Tax=Endocarpon pusillum TaxID=364733 RepID=A0A8H7A4Y9_9EURO|nr:hypothetical protein GJ744_005201 [Endocarpon pusillum]